MTDWSQAACLEADPEVFFVVGEGNPQVFEPAKQWCRRCPIAADCLRYALTHNVDGVWGGTTARARRRIRDQHGLPPPEPLIFDHGPRPRPLTESKPE